MTGKPGWQKILAETIADYRPHPALYGLYGWDEPASDLFAQVGAISDEFRQQAPEYLLHLNIFPNYATSGAIGDSHVPRARGEIRFDRQTTGAVLRQLLGDGQRHDPAELL